MCYVLTVEPSESRFHVSPLVVQPRAGANLVQTCISLQHNGHHSIVIELMISVDIISYLVGRPSVKLLWLVE